MAAKGEPVKIRREREGGGREWAEQKGRTAELLKPGVSAAIRRRAHVTCMEKRARALKRVF